MIWCQRSSTWFIYGFLKLICAIVLSGESVHTLCSGQVDPNSGLCYIYFSNGLSYSDAKSSCQQNGGQLASVLSPVIQQLIQLLLVNNGVTTGIWIGGHRESFNNPTYHLWRWASDCNLHCGRDTLVNISVSQQGCYQDQTNAHDLPFLAQISDATPSACVNACSTNAYSYAGVQNGNQCFCGNSYGQYGQIDTFANSQASCSLSCTADSSQRCGGSGLNSIYYIPGQYVEWGYAKPNNFGGYQTCGILSNANSWKFDDDDCGTTTANYVCSIPLSMCNSGAVKLSNNKCYFISTSNLLNWFDARYDCFKRGGDLVKISNVDERTILSTSGTLTQSKYWVGLVGLVWSWENGNDIVFANWNTNLPNNVDHKCVMMDPGQNYKWFDSGCGDIHGYVCQTLNTTTTTSTTTTTTTTTSPPSVNPAVANNLSSTTGSIPTGTTIVQATILQTGTPASTNMPPSISYDNTTTTSVLPTKSLTPDASNNKATAPFINTTSGVSCTFSLCNGSGNTTNSPNAPNAPSAAASTNDQSSNLSPVIIALIILCIILFILIVIIIIVACCCYCHSSKNKIDLRGEASKPQPAKNQNLGDDYYSNGRDTDKIMPQDQKIMV